jgi:hypothetical protein
MRYTWSLPEKKKGVPYSRNEILKNLVPLGLLQEANFNATTIQLKDIYVAEWAFLKASFLNYFKYSHIYLSPILNVKGICQQIVDGTIDEVPSTAVILFYIVRLNECIRRIDLMGKLN